ncbi:MAG: cell division protein FtsH [Candidatus Cloacimonadota bacterium]|nr:MAG: cell division protein FtsH [Candidatus Cloacimonadota bacterium]
MPDAKNTSTITFWIILLLVIIIAYQLFSSKKEIKTVSYSNFLANIESGQVEKVTFIDREIIYKIGNIELKTHIPFRDPELVRELRDKGIEIESKETSNLMSAIFSWLPFLLFVGFWIFMIKGMRNGAGKVFSFGKSKARLLRQDHSVTTFKDVAGVNEAKEELEEIIEFLREPEKFKKLGGRIPKGVILLGPPGTGKTLLAKAVAGEAKVPFFSISGSDFVEMFVGVGASRVRDLFEQGKKNAPCIIFIDELDAVGRYRGAGIGGGHDEREQTLNQLLVEMDGFNPNESVIVIAATNRPDVLDPALLRPGRFDRQVIVDRPDVRGREGILKVHTRNVPISRDVKLSVIARSTPGFSGADIANLVNEACLIGARRKHRSVKMSDFEEAKDKVIMGKERRSLVLSEEEKRNTAYHESGHVITAKFTPGSDEIHKVTIIPRGRSLGSTHYLPIDERHTYSKQYCEGLLVHLLGGRVADEISSGQPTTGAGDDLKQATDLAKKMVCEWGMSEKLGPITYGKREHNIFLGKEISEEKRNFSQETARLIDQEIKEFINQAYEKARNILTTHHILLDTMAENLLQKETLDNKQINKILDDYLTNNKKIAALVPESIIENLKDTSKSVKK